MQSIGNVQSLVMLAYSGHDRISRPNSNMIIFSDFDGTISQRDTGTFIIDRFLGKERRQFLDKQILDGKVTFREAVVEMWASVKSMSLEEAAELINNQVPLDVKFMEFYGWLLANNITLTVVSSGIKPLILSYLALHFPNGLHESTSVIANGVVVHKERWDIVYLDDSHYGHDKGAHLRDWRRDHSEDLIVFIGDGVSDLPAAMSADIVFAKRGKDLETFCLREKISFIAWNDFGEIQTHLERVLAGEKN